MIYYLNDKECEACFSHMKAKDILICSRFSPNFYHLVELIEPVPQEGAVEISFERVPDAVIPLRDGAKFLAKLNTSF